MLSLDIESKRFPGAGGPVIQDLRLSVTAGECVALVGPSGCGKSTTLAIAAGLDRDFRGTRRLTDGAILAPVFQEPRLLPWRSLEQNVELALPPERRGGSVARDGLARVGLADSAGLFPGQVSLGMQRRASLARAFATRPDLLLLDEPFVSLDPPTARHLRQLLADQMREHGCAALLVTHDLREAIELADRLLVLSARPATLLHTIVLAEPRHARTESRIEDLRRQILDRLEPDRARDIS